MLLTHASASAALAQFMNENDALERNSSDAGYLKELAREKLERLWARAVTSDYYGSYSAVPAKCFYNLPVTPKRALREAPSRFDSDLAAFAIRDYETSGTTGGPIPTPRTMEDIVWNVASVATGWRSVLHPKAKVISLLPSDIAPIGDLIAGVCDFLAVRYMRAYPFAVGVASWDRIADTIRRARPSCLFGAPGVVMQFMRALKQRDIFEDTASSIEDIMLLGEVASEPLQEAIASWWRASVHDASYGSTETGTIATTDGRGKLRIVRPAYLLELEIDGVLRPAEPGLTGELVVTPLNAFARPLLRYATGDVVTLLSSGSEAEMTLKVLGRASDVINVQGTSLSVDRIERLVYLTSGVTGYVVQLAEADSQARLVLERDVGCDVADVDVHRLKQRFAENGVEWAAIDTVSQLSILTKSGAGQKNWKRTHIQRVAHV